MEKINNMYELIIILSFAIAAVMAMTLVMKAYTISKIQSQPSDTHEEKYNTNISREKNALLLKTVIIGALILVLIFCLGNVL